MSQNQYKLSDKLNLINRATYENVRKNGSAQSRQRPIQNSKYKKIHKKIEFSLFDFIKEKHIKQPGQKKLKARPRRVICFNGIPPIRKHRGKIREGGKKRHPTRLKKSILYYRQQKLQQERLNELPLDMRKLQLHSSLHSRRFRDYCDNCTTPHLATLMVLFLRDLDRFQKRAHENNPIKAHAHRRFVLGFREVQSYLQTNKVKLVVIAPDCEPCSGEAGLDEVIANIKAQCQRQRVPYVFSLSRRELAYALFKQVPISCLAVLNYDGANATYAEILEALQAARAEYKIKKSAQVA